MTEQSNDQPTSAPDDATGAGRNQRGYLPTLPDGWHWEATAHGPGNDNRITVKPLGYKDDEWNVHVKSDKGSREVTKTNLNDAAKVAGAAAKGLHHLADLDTKAEAARQKLLTELGKEIEDDTEPEPETVVAPTEAIATDSAKPVDSAK